MSPSRKCRAGGCRIEEFYWNGKYIVYVDDKLTKMTYPEAVEAHMTEAEKAAELAQE